MWVYTDFVLRFLNYLENEIYNSNSPIWHADFNQTPEALAVPSPAGSSKTPTPSPAAGPASNISKIGNYDSSRPLILLYWSYAVISPLFPSQ